MSDNNAEYQRNKRLIESKHLSLNFFNDALYEKAEERLVENDKFMKTTLNLEKFQARDFENIKKIIALTFFAAAWFYFTKKEVLENPVHEKIIYHPCQLGRGKKQIGPLHLQ
jgi:hypothetical protein